MRYFKTLLRADDVKSIIMAYHANPASDYCFLEIENKKNLLISANDLLSTMLANDERFKPVMINETELITIPIIYKIVAITGNRELFVINQNDLQA